MDKSIERILKRFGINEQSSVTQIYVAKSYKGAWDIDGAYVLKSNERKLLVRSIMLNRLLLAEVHENIYEMA